MFERQGANKPFDIGSKQLQDAYLKVRSNGGSAGIDEQDLKSYEQVKHQELYKLWNRMSSGTYFPVAVRGVEIPKGDGKVRLLGIPTVSDRIAQQLVVDIIGERLEAIFHASSHGYRPKRSRFTALESCRQNCYLKAWVIDMDIQGFFDNIDHDLLMKAVRKHVSEKWILLYIERWLKAPMQKSKGELVARDKGTPQGGVISPLLANLYLHYSFDEWMRLNYGHVTFERYADDIIVHCTTQKESEELLRAIRQRMADCKLSLHPEKTKIVYCENWARKAKYPIVSFTFAGYTFKPMRQKSVRKPGSWFTGFGPKVGSKALKKVRDELNSTPILRNTYSTIEDVSWALRAKIRGWFDQYCHFDNGGKDELIRILDMKLVAWIRKKHKQYRHRKKELWAYYNGLKRTQSHLFQHWVLDFGKSAVDQ